MRRFISQIATAREQRLIKPGIEFISAIPSVVLGFFGIAIFGEALRRLSHVAWLAWMPGFPYSERLNVLTAGFLLALLAVPTIFTLAEDALNNVPRAFKEASFALGASRLLIYTTDMWDDGWKGEQAVHLPIIFNDSARYMFADISQVNSRNFDDDHWRVLSWVMEQVNRGRPRPVNHTKIYGGGYHSFGTGGFEDGVERFWRNLLAGSAGVRFTGRTAAMA